MKESERPALGHEAREGPHEARRMNIRGRSSLNKAQLQQAVERRQ